MASDTGYSPTTTYLNFKEGALLLNMPGPSESIRALFVGNPSRPGTVC